MSSGTVRPRPLSKKVVVGHASVQNNFGLEEKAFAPSDVPAKVSVAPRFAAPLRRPAAPRPRQRTAAAPRAPQCSD